jgi:hypothetical protein
MRRFTARSIGALLAIACLTLVSVATAVAAPHTEVVTQNTTTWTEDDTRGAGTVEWTDAYGAPAGLGSSSLELATTASTADKAGLYTHTMAGTPLADVETLGYWTYQEQASLPVGSASFQLQVETGCGFTTLVYEPYWNVTSGPVVPKTWQQWDVDAGLFWSSRTVTCGTGALVAGAGGPPLYTLDAVVAMFPNATVAGIGVNVGTFNPAYTIGVDGVQFNDTTYNFELGTRPSSKDQCKNGGWATFNDPAFSNQGDCVSYVASGGRNA